VHSALPDAAGMDLFEARARRTFRRNLKCRSSGSGPSVSENVPSLRSFVLERGADFAGDRLASSRLYLDWIDMAISPWRFFSTKATVAADVPAPGFQSRRWRALEFRVAFDRVCEARPSVAGSCGAATQKRQHSSLPPGGSLVVVVLLLFVFATRQ